MTNNDILRNLRYTFDLKDAHLISIFGEADFVATEEQVNGWLKKEDDPEYLEINDTEFACFLNGLINDQRGKKEGAQPKPETKLNNNIIFRKLKIAFELEAEEIIDMLKMAEFTISRHELSAFFRHTDHKHYRPCQDQILRNFLQGLYLRQTAEMKANGKSR